jgi:hypothetical protein
MPGHAGMDPALVNLASGVVGAIIGAVVGAFVACRFEVRESEELGKGAMRAVYRELSGNGIAARMAASGRGPLGSIRRDAWTAEMARLGAYLEPAELEAVSWAYQMFRDADAAIATIRSGRPRLGSAFHAILEEYAIAAFDATTLLNPKTWSGRERQALERAPHRRRRREEPPAGKSRQRVIDPRSPRWPSSSSSPSSSRAD